MSKVSSDLVASRERAMDRAERALNLAWPARKGEQFISEMTYAANALSQIAVDMHQANIDPIERSRAYRYLGSVYSDLAPALGEKMLIRARQAYEQAESLLEGQNDVQERARLNFNLANTLRQIGKNDRALLQEAERRFLSARKVFSSSSPQYLPQVNEALASTKNLLQLLPIIETVEQNRSDLDNIDKQLAEGAQFSEIATKMQEVRERGGGVARLFAQVQNLIAMLPESAKKDERYSTIIEQMEKLPELMQGGREMDSQEQEILQMLKNRLQQEMEKGVVDPDRGKILADKLKDISNGMATDGGDIESLMNRAQAMRAKTAAMFTNLHYLSHGIDRPAANTRAAQLVELCWAVRLFLLEEMNRPNKSEREGKLALDLYVRASRIDKSIYEAGSNDSRAITIDQEALRPFALEVRDFAARHYPLFARPIWPGSKVQTDVNVVLYSGSENRRKQVAKACRRLGLDLMPAPVGQDFASSRWSQLQKANVAIFELALDEGPVKAAVSYELGIARTLGKPVVVLASSEQPLPFNVDIEPVSLTDTDRDNSAIAEAINLALVWTMPRPRESSVVDTIREALARYPLPHSNTYVDQTLKQLQKRQNDPDPVAVNAALQTLLTYLDDKDLMVVHPVWRPVYPEYQKQRLFHVMPFRPQWANDAADSIRSACDRHGIDYIRGDRVREINVISSIWEEINRSNHILVDLTGFNANVALELGIAHTIGRRTLMVGQGNTVDQIFPMIAKLRFYSYNRAKGGELGELVDVLLSQL